jgi:hypothetical protein
MENVPHSAQKIHLNTYIPLLYFGIVDELIVAAFVNDFAAIENVVPVCHLAGKACILFDQQYGKS